MNCLNNEYERLLNLRSESIGDILECEFNNSLNAFETSEKFVETYLNKILEDRKEIESDYHKMIFLQLLHNLGEMKYYSSVNINDSRRIVSVNNDCLSLVQILIRDEFHIQAYFRSSDLLGALPIDLEFLCKIPNNFIKYLYNKIGKAGYEEVNENYIEELQKKKVKLKVIFGSLHKLIKN